MPNRHDREIVRLAVPALGSLAAEPLYVLVDTAVVGHLGTPELGGLAVAGTVLTTGFFLFNFLAYGTTASVARLYGASDLRAAAHQAVQGGWLAMTLGVALLAGGWVAAPALVDLVGASEDVRPHALTYLRISLVGSPAVLLTLVGMGYLRGLQNTGTTFVIAGVSNVVNLVLELVLIYGLGFGVGASAAATVFAQAGAAAAYVIVVIARVRADDVSLRPDRAGLRSLLNAGRNLFIRTGSLLLALALATSVAARIGTVAVAAHQIAFQLWSFLALVLDAIAIAGQAMIGRILGSGDREEARAAARRMVQLGIAAGVVAGIAVAALRPVLLPLFTTDDRVTVLAGGVLWVVAALQPLNAAVFVLDGVLIGAGDLRYLAAAMATAAVGVFLPLAVVIQVAGLDLYAVWGALCVLMMARLIGNGLRFRGTKWDMPGKTASAGNGTGVAIEERQPHLAIGVVPVEVDEDDALPRSEQDTPRTDGHHE